MGTATEGLLDEVQQSLKGPLHFATFTTSTRVVRCLLSTGASRWIQCSRLDVMRLLLDAAELHSKSAMSREIC